MELRLRDDKAETASIDNAGFDVEDTIDSSQPSRPTQTARTTNTLSKLAESDTESEDEEVPVQIPRGKMVARLIPQHTHDTSESEDSNDDGGAYERVRKSLIATSAQQEATKEPEHEEKAADAATSEEEDESPVRTQKFRRLATRKDLSSPERKSPSPARSRRSSPGLFVTPDASPMTVKTSKAAPTEDSDSDNSTSPAAGTDLHERVARIRAERKAKQGAEQSKGEQKSKRQERTSKPAHHRSSQDSDSDPDGENGRRLTQQSRPTRKASKKAMEEMNREQQRISRNMQLTHQAKTKKKYGIKDLFAKFDYKQGIPEEIEALPTPDASSVLASSDVEGHGPHDTPPTSPPSQEEVGKTDVMAGIQTPAATAPLDAKEKVTPIAEIMPQETTHVDKGKVRAPEFQHVPVNPLIAQTQPATVQNGRVAPPKLASTDMVDLSDSDEGLEVVKPKSRFPVFDRLPQKKEREAPSLLHLRHLAHLTSPGKKVPRGRVSMNTTELQNFLMRRARHQAQKEKEEKIEELRRRGIHIETEEEREKLQLEIEDMAAQLEKAREEDLKLRKIEKGEAKKNGEVGDGLLSSDESEDEDYVENVEEGVEEVEEEAELELSGSEEEYVDGEDSGNEEELDDEDDAAEPKSNGLLDQEADKDDDEEEKPPTDEQLDDHDELEDKTMNAPARKQATNRTRNVVIDDEDESEDEAPPKQLPQTTQDDGMAAFGFDNTGSTSLGLTQMFAGTMVNLESGSQAAHLPDTKEEQNSLDFLRSLPDTQPGGIFGATPDLLVPNSQDPTSQQGDGLPNAPVSQFNLGISQLIETSPAAFSQTQLSEMPEPTQDAGFELSRSPAGLIPPPSTIDTVMMAVDESPVAKRKGRLQRRKVVAELSEVDEDNAGTESDFEGAGAAPKNGNVFDVMRKAARKPLVDNFSKKTSWAKDVVEEQAEESEDEYAGIGGASDDDSGEEDEEISKMMDESDIKVDERKIAAYYAERAKADDEKNINQLYKDVMNGGFRKRRGGDAFDMSDSEDEVEQRRRKKQMEFQKMRKALLADEKLGKIAQNPKQQAFFRSLEDYDDDPDFGFLNAPDIDMEMEADTSQSNGSQEGNADITVPDSQESSIKMAPVNPLKRKAADSQEKENRPPPHLRRTAPADNLTRKPITIADVQHSVSELLDDPHFVPESQYSEPESEDEASIPVKPVSRKPIIDRLSLSRTASIGSNADAASNMAFHAPSAGAHQPGFRVPSLIRRATSNFSTTTSASSSGANTPVEGSGVRRGGTGRSNIHAQAREAERRAALEKSEARRKASLKKKVGAARGKRSVLGCLDGGFE
ncbi:hypothetical protein K469DRAFT_551309 [Zopfia rhizophila CBS 207.26]|uniref:DNA replication checkpoint mediator MRC1 domain-containing protein n=1 Tax=Zopfia rhizophila CBS 207.26 TaxID=1314779 RepID=A0A6A6EQF6_9PEZI|nr:hypothetical protein K469DRAFT_551309 [Zopfia rhizophila CBS 207.26]